jgi:hypothetical protein
MTSARFLGLIGLCWILNAGCEGAKNSGPATISPPDLELVSAGSEPRKVLRYKVPSGTRKTHEVSIAVELTAGEMGGPMPTIVLTMSYEVSSVMPSGQMTLRATIEKVGALDVPDSKVPAQAVAGPLEQLKGLAINAVLSPNGRVTGSMLSAGTKPLTPELDQQVRSLITSFESTMMALPDEPVGAGAVWRNSRVIEQNGLKLKAVNSVTLAKVSGDLIVYSIDTAMHGDDQSVAQGDTTIQVQDIIGNGGGRGSVDLGTLEINSDLAAEFRSAMTASGDTAPTKMEMATLMKVRPLQAAQGAQAAP